MTSSNNNNELETSVLNTVLNTVRIIKSFSVKREKCNTLNAFMEFVKREHITFSDGVVWALEEFLERHHPPNPSPTLDRLFNLEMPAKPNTICFVPNCRAKPHYQLVLQDFHGKSELFNVCRKHKRWKHPKFRFLVRMKELKT